ncbi:MAG: hypothetical protein QOC92_412, partial [Acidimicrobiaceae bacterium]
MSQAWMSLGARARRRAVVIAVCVVAGLLVAAGPDRARGDTNVTVKVIVRMLPGVSASPDSVLAPVNGHLDRILSTINGFSASVPVENVGRLEATPGVLEVAPDTTLNVPPPETSTSGATGKKVEG